MAETAEASRWCDLRLLDLWSISVLQSCGSASGILALIAIRQGHYVALLLGMMSLVCVSCASLWFLSVVPGTLFRIRKPFMKALGQTRLGRIRRWCLLDALLIASAPLAFTMVTWF